MSAITTYNSLFLKQYHVSRSNIGFLCPSYMLRFDKVLKHFSFLFFFVKGKLITKTYMSQNKLQFFSHWKGMQDFLHTVKAIACVTRAQFQSCTHFVLAWWHHKNIQSLRKSLMSFLGYWQAFFLEHLGHAWAFLTPSNKKWQSQFEISIALYLYAKY